MIRIPVHRLQNPGSCKARGRARAQVVAHAIVDDADAHLLQFYWTFHTGYARRFESGRHVFMHHAVIGRVAGMDVSHENSNKLDNRRANLRHVTRSENMLNDSDGPTARRSSCPYRGVSRDDRSRSLERPWRGKVTVRGKTYQTRRFSTPESARDALAILRKDLRVREMPEAKS